MSRSRNGYSVQDRFGGSGLGPDSKFHGPQAQNCSNEWVWLLLCFGYWGSGAILASTAVIVLGGMKGYLVAVAFVVVWLWFIGLRTARRILNVYRAYRHDDDVKIWWTYTTFRDQAEMFGWAGLSVSQGDSDMEPLTPRIIRHRTDGLGIRLLVEILRSQVPEMFVAATDRLSSAFITPVEVRKFDQSHVEIILKLRDPLTSVRKANFDNPSATNEGHFEDGWS